MKQGENSQSSWRPGQVNDGARGRQQVVPRNTDHNCSHVTSLRRAFVGCPSFRVSVHQENRNLWAERTENAWGVEPALICGRHMCGQAPLSCWPVEEVCRSKRHGRASEQRSRFPHGCFRYQRRCAYLTVTTKLEPGAHYGHRNQVLTIGGLILSEVECQPNASIPEHSHEQTYLSFVLGGSWQESYGRDLRALSAYTGHSYCRRSALGTKW
jgi:hypothetical protein